MSSYTPASPDNEAIRELRDSSKRLEKLTEELSKSSKRLEVFTAFLIFFTLILGVVAIIELVKDLMPTYAVAILGIILLFALLYFANFLKKD